MGIKSFLGFGLLATAVAFSGYRLDYNRDQGIIITKPEHSIEQKVDSFYSPAAESTTPSGQPIDRGFLFGGEYKPRPKAEEFDKARGKYHSSKRWMGS